MKRDKERKNAALEHVKKSVAESDVPLPDEILKRVLDLFITDALSALRCHAGFILAERREHYHASLSIMHLSLDDLEVALANFEQLATADKAEIMLPKNSQKLEAIGLRIQKELFSTANAAASLVDHARRLQKRFDDPKFNEKLQECFKGDGLHDLVIGLRILLHHMHIVKAGWSVSSEFATGNRSACFMINLSELERAIDQSFDRNRGEPIRHYIMNCPEQINLRNIFAEYRERLELFYSWFNQQIDVSPPLALKDYDRCILEKNRHSVRMTWNALVGNWLNSETVPNVQNHLPSYLRDEQLEAVYNLPANSKEQADLIIEYLDTYGAIDDSLRSKIHQLFERLSTQSPI